jgi:hypothetical protein
MNRKLEEADYPEWAVARVRSYPESANMSPAEIEKIAREFVADKVREKQVDEVLADFVAKGYVTFRPKP